MSADALVAAWGPPFLLLLCRAAGLVGGAPLLGDQGVPAPVKAGLALSLALVLTAVQGPGLRLPRDPVALAAGLLGEACVGALLGLAVRFTFAGVGLAGELISVQMGLSMPSGLDPQSLMPVSAVNQFLAQVSILAFLGVDGHHALLAALAQSLRLVPPLQVALGGDVLAFLLGLFQASLVLAIRVAAPVSAAVLAATITLGLLSRIAPQVNLFMLSYVLTVGIGLLVLLAALPVLVSLIANSFRELPAALTGLVARLSHGL